MLAERFILHTDSKGHLTDLPVFPPNEDVEVIVLHKEPKKPKPRNQPSSLLAWRGAKLFVDDIAPAFSIEEWGELFQENHLVRHDPS